MVEDGDANVLDANNKRRGSGTTGAAVESAEKLIVVGSDEDTNDERRATVEDGKTPDEAASSLGNVATRSDSLTGSNGNQLGGGDEGEAGGDEGVPKGEEAASRAPYTFVLHKGPWMSPVIKASHMRLIGAAAKEDDDAENDEAHDGEQLDTGKPKLGLAKELNGNDIEEEHDEEDDGNPDGNVDLSGARPVVDDYTGGGGFCSDEDGVDVPVVPAGGKGKGGIDEALDKVGDGDAAHGQESDHFGKTVHDGPDNGHHEDVGHEEWRGAALAEDGTGTDKETGTDGTTEGEELNVSTLETALELVMLVGEVEFGGLGGLGGLDVEVVAVAGAMALVRDFFLHVEGRSAQSG